MKRAATGFAFALAALLLFLVQPAHAVSVCVPSCTPAMRAQMIGAFSGTPTLDFSADFSGCAIPPVDDKYSKPIGGGPVKFDALLSKYADDDDLGDKKVVLKAMMLLESNADPTMFNQNRDGSYDIGLMQANSGAQGPHWPQYSFSRSPDFSSTASAWCPQVNFEIGVDNFKHCLQKYQNDRDALCCYNTGRGCANNDNGYKYLAAYSNALVRVYGYGG